MRRRRFEYVDRIVVRDDRAGSGIGRALYDLAVARTVVEASLQLGQWLLDGERGDVPGLMGRTAAMLRDPA